jgi:outer membrane protein OmpA-like peptidoglycan-associated protein
MSSKEIRNPRVLALGLMLTLPSIAVGASPDSPAASGKASREESTGVASGLVIGAAAAGPFGAVIGAATGAWFGDRWHAQRKTTLAARELTHQFGFRTDSATLEPDATEALRQLALLAQRLPGTRLRVVGAADPRGNPDYNLALSRRRAEAVAAVLRGAGIDGDRLVVEGVGAVPPDGATPDPDGWAFARRVTVTFEPAGPTRT